jgi:hypothetical protein
MSFWEQHFSFAEVARKLGCSRQNIHQECKRKKIPFDRDDSGKPGIPKDWVYKTLELRGRDANQPA